MVRVANRDSSKGKAKDKGKDNKARAGSKGVSRAVRLRADRSGALEQGSVTEPTVEAIATQVPAADASAACTTILIREITHRAEVPLFSPTILLFLPNALTMTACAI